MNIPSLAFLAVAALGLAGLLLAFLERRRADAAQAMALACAERAAQAEARAHALETQALHQGELLKAEAARQASLIAEDMARRSDETQQRREALVEARLQAQLKPVAETLARFQEQLANAERARAADSGGLRAQISQMMTAAAETQAEARRLSQALRRGAGVQGRWGEQTLRNVLEAAGLSRHYDFDEQSSVEGDAGRLRPDVTVRLPGGAVFVIDAKCSLNAYLEAQDAADEAAREACYLRHAQSVRAHLAGLSAKAYWEQFEASPDFVAMFIPGDSFLAAALERAPDLLTEAMDRRVLLVTPTTLFALCKAVVYGWRVEEQAKNAQEISSLGRELYKRLSIMGGHVAGLGKALEAAVGRYNQFVGSLESQVLTQARRFEELRSDHQGRELVEPSRIDVAVRTPLKLSAAAETRSGTHGPRDTEPG